MHNAPTDFKYRIKSKPDNTWREVDGIWRFCDKYGWRYVTPLAHRVTAFVFNVESFIDTERIVYWYQDFDTPQDAINAAKNWALRRLEFEKDRSAYLLPVNHKTKSHAFPNYEIEQRASEYSYES